MRCRGGSACWIRHRLTMSDVTLSDIEQLRAEAGAADAVFEMDEAAFRALYDRTARALWAYLARITGSADLRRRSAPGNLLSFLRSRPDYESDAHRRHSLFRIATNLAHDSRRRGVRAHAGRLVGGALDGCDSTSPPRPSGAPISRGRCRTSGRASARCSGWPTHRARRIAISPASSASRPQSVRLLLFRARQQARRTAAR